MSFKLSIRRRPAFLPSLCLVGLLVFIALFVWLCHFGVPDCVLQRIESAAREQGITLHMGSLTLSPKNGLALRVRDLSIEREQPDAPPMHAKARRLIVAFNFTKLFSGDYLPTAVILRDAELALPLSGEEALKATGLDVRADRHNDKLIELRLVGNLNGVHTALKARLNPDNLRRTDDSAASESPDIDALLTDCRPKLLTLCREVQQQHWAAPDIPRLGMRLDWTEESPDLRIVGTVPSYDYRSLHFRDIRLDVGFADNHLTIWPTGFKTVEPDSEVSVSGSYDFTKRSARFALQSTADVLQIARDYLGEDAERLLSEEFIEARQAPEMELEGQVTFNEDFALTAITLNGNLHQEGLRLGQTASKALDLDFYFENGNLNLSKCRLEWQDGSVLGLSGIIRDGKGHAELTLKAPIGAALGLVRDLNGGNSLVPDTVQTDGMLETHVELKADTPLFVPGETSLGELIPTLREVSGSLQLGSAAYAGTRVNQPAVQWHVSGIEYDADRLHIAKLELSTRADEAAADGNSLSGWHLDVQGDGFELPLNGGVPTLDSLSGTLHSDRLVCGNTELSGFDLNLSTLRQAVFDPEAPKLPAEAELSASISALNHGGHTELRDVALSLSHGPNSGDSLTLTATLNGEPLHLSLCGSYRGGELPTGIHIDRAEAEFPVARLEALLNELESNTDLIKLPPLVRLRDISGDIDFAPFALNGVKLSVEIPELVRTPQYAMLKGRDVALSISTDLELRTDAAGRLLYSGSADIIHNPSMHQQGAEGQLTPDEIHLRFDSPTPESVHLTGTSTITADVADALIDDADAHSILRDFRFRPDSRVTATDIDALIDWGNGTLVHVTCRGDVRDSELLLLGTEETTDAAGNVISEQMSKRWGNDPMASIKHASCGVEVDLRYDIRGADGQLLPDVQKVYLTDPELVYDNRPWLKRQGFKGGVAESTVSGKAVTFDLEQNTLTLTELGGNCYPAYAFGTFFPDLMTYMETVILQQPVDVSTHECVFPLAKSCTVPMSGTIRATGSSGAAFRFLGTDIPLEDFSGFVTLTDTEVQISRLNALCWEGVVNATVNISITGGHTGFNGYVQADNMNLTDIGNAYGETFSPAMVNADLRFRCPDSNVRSLKGYGQVQILDGNLEELHIFQPVSMLLSYVSTHIDSLLSDDKEYVQRAIDGTFNRVITTYDHGSSYIPFLGHVALDYDIRSLSAPLYISDGMLQLTGGMAQGKNLRVAMSGGYQLAESTLNMNLGADMTLIIPKLSKWRFNIALSGPLKNPAYRIYVRLLPKKGAASSN